MYDKASEIYNYLTRHFCPSLSFYSNPSYLCSARSLLPHFLFSNFQIWWQDDGSESYE